MKDTDSSPNPFAILSLIAAILTVFSFCGGAAPIPLTGWVCFPTAILLGAAALVSGIAALRQIRVSGENGRGMALVSVWTGGLTILATICSIVLTISVITTLVIQFWKQIQP